MEDNHKSDLTTDEDNIVSPKNGKHVRWQDLSRINNKKITFKHSKPKKQNTSKIKVRNLVFIYSKMYFYIYVTAAMSL